MTLRTSPETEESILKLRSSGLSYASIASRVGMPRSTIAAVIKRHGEAVATPAPRPDDEILRRHDEGDTYEAIASALGISTATVHKALTHAGRTRTRPRWTVEKDTLLSERYAAGDTHAAIAKLIGFSESAVSARIRQHGLTRETIAPTRHGRPACWQTGCQHPVCIEARREYKHAEYQRGINVGPASHGLAGYTRGCRCTICTAAHQASMAGRQNRTRPTAIAHGERWSTDEDEAIMQGGIRIEDLARDIGRTYAAIDNRRRLLAKRYED